MSNPFSGIITPALKALHKNMIDALLEDTALTVECILIYADTKFSPCPNCIFNTSMDKSSGKYKSGGPIPFTNGACPYCNGVGKTKTESTEPIFLMPIWDSSKWLLSNPALKVADIALQTMSSMSVYNKLMRCSKIKISTKITKFGIPEFTRVGHPEPLGWGDDNFIITSWKRV